MVLHNIFEDPFPWELQISLPNILMEDRFWHISTLCYQLKQNLGDKMWHVVDQNELVGQVGRSKVIEPPQLMTWCDDLCPFLDMLPGQTNTKSACIHSDIVMTNVAKQYEHVCFRNDLQPCKNHHQSFSPDANQ